MLAPAVMSNTARLLALLCVVALAGCPSGSAPAADVGTDAPPPCPADPPADDAACTSPMTCHWLRCADAGAVTARCDGARWAVTAAPCPIDCNGTPCASGQICAVFQGGAQIHMCVEDPCDGAALETCLCDACPIAGAERCARSAFTVTCNTCAADVCP